MRLTIATLIALLMLLPQPASAQQNDETVCAGNYADAAIAACTRLIDDRTTSQIVRARAFNNRGTEHGAKTNYDRAIADYTEAIRLKPDFPEAFYGRGWAHNRKKDYDRAIADFTETIRLKPDFAQAFNTRGAAHEAKRSHDRAIADYTEAIRLKPDYAVALHNRGVTHESRKSPDRAIADYQAVLRAPDAQTSAGSVHALSRARLAALSTSPTTAVVAGSAPPPGPVITPAPATISIGRRVALVIGNSAYAHVSALPNPRRDAEAIAKLLRQVGFVEVRTLMDASFANLASALKSFGDLAEGADWAMVYFAGHGIELGGTPFLIPVDAKLERDTHVRDEAIALDRVLEKVATARQLRLVVLDACRNNPFAARMTRTAGYTRSVDRGLSRVEPDGDVLVAYSAKHGTLADDGTGQNSPFVAALLEQMPQPGVDIRIMFGRVRDSVRKATSGRQEPYLYGSVGGESHMFVPARR